MKTRTAATDPWATVWSRFVAGTDGLGLVESSDGSSKIQITNVHDDVVTQIDNTTTFAGLTTYAEQTEYGIARDPDVKVDGNYGWLGGQQRSTDTVGGLTLMGARLYNPVSGRFLSMDPVPGGNDNTYTYPPDPVNMTDLSGEWGIPKFIKKVAKKVIHVAKKTYRAVRKFARAVVKTVVRKAKVAKRYVKVAARAYYKEARIVRQVAKKKVKSAAKRTGHAVERVKTKAKKTAKSAAKGAWNARKPVGKVVVGALKVNGVNALGCFIFESVAKGDENRWGDDFQDLVNCANPVSWTYEVDW